jgi:hypothetical protein
VIATPKSRKLAALAWVTDGTFAHPKCTLSKKANGDIEVSMPREIAVQLAAALSETTES